MEILGLIFAAVVIVGPFVLMVILRRGNHQCAWCHKRTVKLGKLPDAVRGQVGDLIREEGMDPALSYELCEACRRIFDEWWFQSDWICMTDGALADSNCRFRGTSIRENSGKAVADLPPAVITLLSERYTPDDMAHLRRGYDDLDCRFEKSPEEHPLRVCDICHRIYMWVEIKGFQVFQCVSSGREKYERVSDRRQMET